MITLNVLTYNIRHARGMDDRVDLSRIADVLASSEADIICLQEVDRGLPRSGMIHQAEALASALDFSFTYFTNFGVAMSGMGNAILSRFPLYSTWNKLLPFTGEPRGLLQATLSHPDIPIDVYCTHWGLDSTQRLKQSHEAAFATLSSRMIDSRPIIVCGDLNAEPSAMEVETFRNGSHLFDLGPYEALTYPTDALRAKIDYVFVSGNVVESKIKTIQSDASDHLPILAEIRVWT